MPDASTTEVVNELLRACKYALYVLESIPEDYCDLISDIIEDSINIAILEDAITKAERFRESSH